MLHALGPRKATLYNTASARRATNDLRRRFVLAAINTYGGWGDEYYSSFVAPYYKEEYKTARVNGESGWDCPQRQAPL